MEGAGGEGRGGEGRGGEGGVINSFSQSKYHPLFFWPNFIPISILFVCHSQFQ